MNDAKYIGLDVHQATISAAVLDSAGQQVCALRHRVEGLGNLTEVCIAERNSTAQPRCLPTPDT